MNTPASYSSKAIPTIVDRNYWFVRTDSGRFFDDFYENNYNDIDEIKQIIPNNKTNISFMFEKYGE